MLRSQFVRGLAMTLLATAFAATPGAPVFATSPQDPQPKPEDKNYTPEQKYERRYPQPAKVSHLIGLPMLDDRDTTLGCISEVVRDGSGKIFLIVPYRAWLAWAPTSWGRKTVAVPLEAVAILARQVITLDVDREFFAGAAEYSGKHARLPPDDTIRVAVYRR